MDMPAALALIALSAPITAGILKLFPTRGQSAGGTKLAEEVKHLGLAVARLETKIDLIFGKTRLTHP